MKTSVAVLAVLCVFGAALVKGFDKKAAIVDFMAKVDVCNDEVGSDGGNFRKTMEYTIHQTGGNFPQCDVPRFLCINEMKLYVKNIHTSGTMTEESNHNVTINANGRDVAELVARLPSSRAEGKCLRACISKKYEVMDGNGKLVKDVAIKYAEVYTDGAADQMKVAHEIIDTCGAVAVPDDHCEAAEAYGKCFQEQMKAHGISDFVM